MDAPAEWTYDGLIDWSSPAKLKLLPVQMPLRCIIEALRERCSVIPYLPSILSTSFNPLATIKECADAIQSAVTTLISYNRFARHTDEGRWGTIYSPAIPLWTEADILTQIGAGKRLVLDRLETLGEWLFQQYQILNLLRWGKLDPGGLWSGSHKVKEGSESWPSAWTDGSHNILQFGGLESHGEGKSLYKERKRVKIDFSSQFTYQNFDMNIWIWAMAWAGEDQIYVTEEYTQGINYRELGTVNPNSPILWVGNIDDEPGDAPTDKSAHWEIACQDYRFPPLFIKKFDVPGGFKFVA